MSPRALSLSLLCLSATLAQRTARAQTPPPAPAAHAPTPDGRVRIAFGQGATMSTADGNFELNLRARIQTRFTLTSEVGSGEEPATEFSIRRMRVVFQGHAIDRALQYYIQLGFSNRDTESDLRLPLRDAYVTWTRWRDVQIRAGQMKVPFDRQRVVSSSALQFVDRSIVTSELNLDRDVGVQVFSRDLLGLGNRLGYQLGVFGGDGRNRLSSTSGLLWVARLEFTPFGRFDDYVEGDLERLDRPRLAVGVGVAYNQNTVRARSTFDATYALGGFDYLHGEVDLAFKWRGLSVLGAAILRRADVAVHEGTVDGAPRSEFSRSYFGWFAQAGYLFNQHLELVARYGDLRPTVLDTARFTPLQRAQFDREQRARHEVGGGLNWYFQGHSLKLQTDYFYYFSERLDDRGEHQARVQLQLFF